MEQLLAFFMRGLLHDWTSTLAIVALVVGLSILTVILFKYLVVRCTFTLRLTDQNRDFRAVQKAIYSYVRNATYGTAQMYTDDEFDEEDGVNLTKDIQFAPTDIKLFNNDFGFPIYINCYSKVEGYATRFYIDITTLALNIGRETIKKLLIKALNDSQLSGNKKIVNVFMNKDDEWDYATSKKPRSLDSVIIPKQVKDNLINNIDKFLASEEIYAERGIPWRLGFLFAGPPGNGKTSTIMALAEHYHMHVYWLSLKERKADDSTITSLLANLGPRTILVLEEIDTFFTSRSESSNEGVGEAADADVRVSLGGFLAAIDGIASADGRILIMTTNHPDRLDPALVRPGRADKTINFTNATPELIQSMYKRFFPTHSPAQIDSFVLRYKDKEVNMATIQGDLINYENGLG